MEDSKTLFSLQKFPQAHEKISSNFIDNLDTRSQNFLPALLYICGATATLHWEQRVEDQVPSDPLYWKAYEDILVLRFYDLHYFRCRKQETEHRQKARGC